jgi:hypothetical protein
VLNYEEGAESCVLNGDAHSETLLSEMSGLSPRRGARDLSVESNYEYGSRGRLTVSRANRAPASFGI